MVSGMHLHSKTMYWRIINITLCPDLMVIGSVNKR